LIAGVSNTFRGIAGVGGINPFRGVPYSIELAVLLNGAPVYGGPLSVSQAIKDINPSLPGLNPRPASQSETYDVFSDLVSTGTEIELIANPTPNWRVSASFARTDAVESNIAAGWFDFIKERLPVWAQYKNSPAHPETTGRTVNALVVGNAINSWNFIKQQDGQRVQQMVRDRANGTVRYGFSTGPLKGAFVGGSWRYRSPSVVGYGAKIAKGSELDFSEGFLAPNATLAVNDITKPIRGQALNEFDGFLGYSRRIMDNKVAWRVQLNIRNLFDDVDRRAQRTLSTGEVAVFTIPEARTFILTNTFTF
jgi:hypothetical protein